MQSAYQRIKERLVGLSVELDDKNKTVVILNEAIARERSEAQTELEELVSKRQREFEAQTAAHKKELNEVLRFIFNPTLRTSLGLNFMYDLPWLKRYWKDVTAWLRRKQLSQQRPKRLPRP